MCRCSISPRQAVGQGRLASPGPTWRWRPRPGDRGIDRGGGGAAVDAGRGISVVLIKRLALQQGVGQPAELVAVAA